MRESPDTRDEFAVVTWLHEVVISAIVETLDDVILGCTRCEHDDGCSLSLGSELATDLDAVHTRKFDIEDDDIIVIIDSFHISFGTVSSECTCDILVREVASDSLCQCNVVFDKECMHT